MQLVLGGSENKLQHGPEFKRPRKLKIKRPGSIVGLGGAGDAMATETKERGKLGNTFVSIARMIIQDPFAMPFFILPLTDIFITTFIIKSTKPVVNIILMATKHRCKKR